MLDHSPSPAPSAADCSPYTGETGQNAPSVSIRVNWQKGIQLRVPNMPSRTLKCFFKKILPFILALLMVVISVSCAKKNPAKDYARELNLPPAIAQQVEPLGYDGEMDANDKAIIDEIYALPENLQIHEKTLNYLKEIVGDEQVTNQEVSGFGNLDHDEDGLTYKQEKDLGTDPLNPDTDDDGLGDEEEVLTYGTDPLKKNPAVCYAVKNNLPLPIIQQIKTLDDKFDGNAKEFINTLANSSILQSQTLNFLIAGGISSEELEFFNQSQHLSYLIDDLFGLPEIRDGIEPKDVTATEQIVNLIKSDDPEVQQGLTLIDRYGVPPTIIFGRSQGIPNHNTQLQVLFWLAGDNVIDADYDRIALALALDYGSVVTIGDNEVDQRVKGYVQELLICIKETDKFLEGKNLPWRAKNYPLLADVGLVWGANEIRYPTFYECVGAKPGQPWTHNWYEEFIDRQMNLEDFNWLFISPETLREMREWLSKRGFINADISRVANAVDSYASKHLRYYTDKPGVSPSYFEVEGKITPGCRISNPDWQWSYFNKKAKVIGNCEDVCFIDEILLKSLNISTLPGSVKSESFGHRVILYYDEETRTLRTTSYQLGIIDRNAKGEISYKVLYIPWNNFIDKMFRSLERTTDKKLLQKGISLEDIFMLK